MVRLNYLNGSFQHLVNDCADGVDWDRSGNLVGAVA